MATLTIRNLPGDLHAQLKERAQRNRRSLNQEVIVELSAVGNASSDAARKSAAHRRMETTLEEIEKMREGMTRFLSPEEITAAIGEGRA